MNKKFAINTYNYDSILSPILFLILGIVVLTNPVDIIKISLFIFCLILFLLGLFKNLLYYKKPDDKKDVVFGTIYMTAAIIIAIIVFFAFSTIEWVFRIGFALFLAYTGIIKLINGFKKRGNTRLLYLLSSVLIILSAIVLAILSKIQIQAVGVFIILYSIIEIIGYILYHKYEAEDNTIKEANIIKEIVTTDEQK